MRRRRRRQVAATGARARPYIMPDVARLHPIQSEHFPGKRVRMVHPMRVQIGQQIAKEFSNSVPVNDFIRYARDDEKKKNEPLHTHTHTRTHAHAHAHTRTHARTHTHRHTHIRTHERPLSSTFIHACAVGDDPPFAKRFETTKRVIGIAQPTAATATATATATVAATAHYIRVRSDAAVRAHVRKHARRKLVELERRRHVRVARFGRFACVARRRRLVAVRIRLLAHERQRRETESPPPPPLPPPLPVRVPSKRSHAGQRRATTLPAWVTRGHRRRCDSAQCAAAAMGVE